MNFESLFQNLVGILKCTFKQSCRESNSKQLLFCGQDLKMPFSSSNLNLGAVWVKFDLKKKKRKSDFRFVGPRPPFGPATEAGLACSRPRPRRRPDRARPRTPRGGHAPASSPCGTAGPPSPRLVRAPVYCPHSTALPLALFLSRAAPRRTCRHCRRHRAPRTAALPPPPHHRAPLELALVPRLPPLLPRALPPLPTKRK
jgi:hypothetical protein